MTEPRTMQAWRTHAYGEPRAALHLDTVAIPEPGPGEVLVRVQAIPINLNDLERIRGGNMMAEPTLPYSPGMETMGVVEACGEGAEGWKGRRVVAITRHAHGGFAQYVICPAASAFDMPEAIPLPDAAALLFPFHLAWLGLFDRAELKAGESVLIHAAAGGSGSAAIQLAVQAGARVFATAGSDDKLALCRELGAEVALNYRTEDFVQVVLEKTGRKGVDVVFDNVGEALLEKSLRATAYNGRFLMMGFSSNKKVADEKFIVPRQVCLANIKLCGVLLAYVSDPMGAMLKQGMGWNFPPQRLGTQINQKIVELILARKVRPVIGKVLQFAEIPAACEAMAASKTIGRTVIVL
jgi:NADPH:quinone reductase